MVVVVAVAVVFWARGDLLIFLLVITFLIFLLVIFF
jgi:hypothetical protein